MVKRPYGTPESSRHQRAHIQRVKGRIGRRETHTPEAVWDDLGRMRVRCKVCGLPRERFSEWKCSGGD